MKIKASLRKKLNKKITDATGTNYFDSIPVNDIANILSSEGIEMANEDGSPFSAIFCGASGETQIDLTVEREPVENLFLRLSWYRMESGRYEIVSYLT